MKKKTNKASNRGKDAEKKAELETKKLQMHRKEAEELNEKSNSGR